tara:strand:- start:61 stop:450 length:390 start_codon:yes stop_codon:yes gene_type:complete
MSSIQEVRAELSTLLSAVAQSYDYLPGSAQLPSVVVGLPDRIQHSITAYYWRLDLPVYCVTRSVVALDSETELLELVVQVVAALKGATTGTTYSSLKVVDTTDLYPITVGATEANSAQVNVEIMILTPS